MLPSVSNLNSLSSIQHSPQGNNSPAITTRLACLEKKLSSIEPGKTPHEINIFKDFITQNKSKILESPEIVDKLTASLNLVNSINDNTDMEIDNTSNFKELYSLIDQMETILNVTESECIRIGSIVITNEQIAKEVQRVGERVSKEIVRSSDKITKELNRFMKRF